MTRDNYLTALGFIGIRAKRLGISVHGEPLLHPDVCEYVKIAQGYGVNLDLHTNGLLLTESLTKQLIENGLKGLEVSIHTEEGYNNYKMAYDINEVMGKPLEMVGNVLGIIEDKVLDWASKDKHYPLMIHPKHNWALDEPHPATLCIFIKNELCVMKWDGTIVACCFDFDGDTAIGHIKDFAKLVHKPEYKLCSTCSPSWTTNQNSWWRII
jgi:hypothetical protein